MSEFVLKQRGMSDENSKARAAFQPGLILYGFCCGAFGRDSYGPLRIMRVDNNQITASDKRGIIHTSFFIGTHTSWLDLLESSNQALASGDYDTEWGDDD